MAKTSTIVFSGGGTGGHLFPGVAVAEALSDAQPDTRVLFLGSGREIESRVLASTPFEHRALPVLSTATLRRNPVRFARSFWKSIRLARQILTQERAAIVVGLGGYASAPAVSAALRLRIPVVLLEQNAVAGRATRRYCGRARVVCTSFEQTQRLHGATEVCFTGNPVRRQIAALNRESAAGGESTVERERRTLLILGGSQGARGVNAALIAAAGRLRESLCDWRIVHLSGVEDADRLRVEYAGLDLDAVVKPFAEDVASLYRDAGVVVSRAGATSLAEIACAGAPAVLIPYPNSADDHQMENARVFETAGAARVVEQRTNPVHTAERLAAELKILLDEPAVRQTMSAAMFRIARPHAAESVFNVLTLQL